MRQAIYNLAAALWPVRKNKQVQLAAFGFEEKRREDFLRRFSGIMRRYQVYGASFALFHRDGICAHALWGDAHRGLPVRQDTCFRVASVSKMITAACVLKMQEQGVVSLDEDINAFFPYPINNGWPVTLRTLMSHRAGFRDGESYLRLVGTDTELAALLNADNYRPCDAENQWAYSNFGAGVIASVLEAKTGISFETLMQRCLFEPLDIKASFYPQHIQGDLADAFQVLPPGKAPAFDASARKSKTDAGWDAPDPTRHYGMAQGNCCIDMEGAVKIAQALMVPGFLKEKTLEEMRRPLASFAERDWRLQQGLGLFVLDDPSVAPYTLYGHQGLAYGAVHGVFFDAAKQSGMVFLSSGAALKRSGVMADVNLELMRMWQQWQIS